MTDLNCINLTGRLTRDIKLYSTSKGGRYAFFELAVNGPNDKEGKHATDYIACQIWGKPAELLQIYGKKGTRIMIASGSLKTFVKDVEGTNVKYTYIAARGFEFLDKFKDDEPKSAFDGMGETIPF